MQKEMAIKEISEYMVNLNTFDGKNNKNYVSVQESLKIQVRNYILDNNNMYSGGRHDQR